MKTTHRPLLIQGQAPSTDRFREDVLRGLLHPQKELPCKYFYDARGSQLFEEICELEEYYPTRAELAIMARHAGAMAARLGPDCALIEYGSGASRKTRLLLDRLQAPAAYVPIDISGDFLAQSAQALSERHPNLDILPVCADFTEPLELPTTVAFATRRVIYFPGSTIGNFGPEETHELLRRVRRYCGPGGGFLVGVDLKKDPRILERAYDDARGITRDFNLNLLERINRELGANFRVDRFRHRAVYNPGPGRIEMHLVSLERQTVRIGAADLVFAAGETIRTECSYKFSLDDFRALASHAGMEVEQVWTDPERRFSVQWLVFDK